MKIYTLPDIAIAATGVAQPVLATGNQLCKWYQVQGKTVATEARVGDAHVSATRGIVITQDSGQFSPPIAEPLNQYDLADVYLVGTSADVLAVNYAI